MATSGNSVGKPLGLPAVRTGRPVSGSDTSIPCSSAARYGEPSGPQVSPRSLDRRTESVESSRNPVGDRGSGTARNSVEGIDQGPTRLDEALVIDRAGVGSR